MRMRSWLMLGIGYLAGTRAGREKFEELRNSIQGLASSDATAEMVGKVRDSLGLPQSAKGLAGGIGGGAGKGDADSSGDTEGSADQEPSGWQQEDGGWVPDESAETKSDDSGQADSPGETDGDASKKADTTAEA